MSAISSFRARPVPWKRVATYGLATVFSLYLVLPFTWLIISSFMTEAEALSVPPHWIPEQPTLENYRGFLAIDYLDRRALVAGQGAAAMPAGIANSTIVGVSVAVLNLVLGSMAAYGLARLDPRGSQALILFFLGSRMVPTIVLAIPLFVIIRGLGLLDNVVSLIVTHTSFALPLSIWVLKSYFQTIPRDLEDAARVDGCGWLGMMWRIFLPLAVPGLVTVAMFSFMLSWNEFLMALLFTSTPASKTVPVIVSMFATDVGVEYTLMVTAGVLTVIPPIGLALLFQRLIVQGLASGAVKG